MSGPRDRFDRSGTAGYAFAAGKRRRAMQLELQDYAWRPFAGALAAILFEQREPAPGSLLEEVSAAYNALEPRELRELEPRRWQSR